MVKDPNYYDAGKVHLDKVVVPDHRRRRPRGSTTCAPATSRCSTRSRRPTSTRCKADSNLQLLTSESLGYQGITVNLGNVDGVGKPAGTLPRRYAGPMATDAAGAAGVRAEPRPRGHQQGGVPGQVHAGLRADQPGQPVLVSDAAQACPKHDPAAAKQLLQQAGVHDAVQGQHDRRQHAGRRPARAGDPGPGQGRRLRPQAGADRVRRLARPDRRRRLPDVPDRLVRPGRPGRQHRQLRPHRGLAEHQRLQQPDVDALLDQARATDRHGQRRPTCTAR